MSILFGGEIRFTRQTENPWLSLEWARKTRLNPSAATLDCLMHDDLAYTAHALASAGFNAVSLANPSLLAQGHDAFLKTHKKLLDLGIPTLGAGVAEQAYQPRVIDAGERLGVVACAYRPGFSGFARSEQAGIANAQDPRILEAARIARQSGARFVYLQLNAGRPSLPIMPRGIDYAKLLVTFDGIIITGPRIPTRVRRASSGFVVSPGAFYDASINRYRWACAAWAEDAKVELWPISQRANPPLTRGGTSLPLQLLQA